MAIIETLSNLISSPDEILAKCEQRAANASKAAEKARAAVKSAEEELQAAKDGLDETIRRSGSGKFVAEKVVEAESRLRVAQKVAEACGEADAKAQARLTDATAKATQAKADTAADEAAKVNASARDKVEALASQLIEALNAEDSSRERFVTATQEAGRAVTYPHAYVEQLRGRLNQRALVASAMGVALL